jgi:Polyketide cyclase / dehydrase and lipid transport
MLVDVATEIEIERPRGVVASYASEPDNATAWYQNIKAAGRKTPGPVSAGSRIAFTAVFLGRRLSYTYEVSEFVPDERLVMRTSEGPFPMETTYTWRDARPGATLMTLRNRGEPSGFSRLAAPMMARSMRSANRKDLARLKAILESEGIQLRLAPEHRELASNWRSYARAALRRGRVRA